MRLRVRFQKMGKVRFTSHRDVARTWYDRAAEWMEKNRPRNEALRRFRMEAEELLGINAKPE